MSLELQEFTPSIDGTVRSLEAVPGNGRVFDWDTAAAILAKRGLERRYASAGLAEDWAFTGGRIFAYGRTDLAHYIYTFSAWATPVLVLHDGDPYTGEVIPCFVKEGSRPWDAETLWPPTAMEILKGG